LLKVCAVSYLNTVPLVWGFLRGPQRGIFDVFFRVPAECADMVAAGEADVGIIPSFELDRQKYDFVRGVGIISRGPVRSILLISKRPLPEIATLAADCSSRTSVALARIVLARRYGVAPRFFPAQPDMVRMLDAADAALIIGDPALYLDPATLPFHVCDLGREWTEMTGLPMVFAVWAGRKECITKPVVEAFQASCRFGLEHIDEIVPAEAERRGLPVELVRRYLTSHIAYELGPAEHQGLELFLRYAHAGLTLDRAV
jgi:chorismate dehydratase